MTQTIEVTIPKAGIATGAKSMKFETKGFVGDTCKNATKALENMLGRVLQDSPTFEQIDPPMQEHLHEGG